MVVSQKNLWFVDFFRAKIIWISKIRYVIINFLSVQRMCFPILLHLEINVTEAILSRTFFKDFEASGFQENVSTRIVNLKRRNEAFLCRD